MAISDLAALRSLKASPQQLLQFLKSYTHATAGQGGWSSTWTTGGWPAAGSVPGAAASCDRATTGALGQANASAGSLYMALRKTHVHGRQTSGGGFSSSDNLSKVMIIDRISHCGGMDGTLTSAQNTGGMVLTRTYPRMFAALEIYTGGYNVAGATATMSYTDQDGNAGQISQPITWGEASTSISNRFLPFSLAAGDTGVNDVASVTLSASGGVVGNFGVTMYRPLLTLATARDIALFVDGDPVRALAGFLPTIQDNACLQVIVFGKAGGQHSAGVGVEATFMES